MHTIAKAACRARRNTGWADNHKFKFDFIINTADATDKFKLSDYFGTLKVNGTFQ